MLGIDPDKNSSVGGVGSFLDDDLVERDVRAFTERAGPRKGGIVVDLVVGIVESPGFVSLLRILCN